MKDNPNIKVEIGAHTDPRNTVEYNDILSQKRAESVVKHMVKNGIDPERLIAKGYGERIPLVVKKDTMGLTAGTELTHKYIESIEDPKLKKFAYQLDRRTEFKIVGFVDGVELEEEIEVIKNGEQDEIIEEEKVKYQELIIKKHFEDENLPENDVLDEEIMEED